MEQIINSYNIFVDTSHAITSGSKGDDFHVNLQDSGVHAGDGQIIRVNLQEFSMYKNFFDVNMTNSKFKVRAFDTSGNEVAGSPIEKSLTYQNMPAIAGLADEFARQVKDAVHELTGLADEPDINYTMPTDGMDAPAIISFTLTFGEQHGLRSGKDQNAGIFIEFSEEDDTYQLLGGDRKLVTETGDFNSISVDTSKPFSEEHQVIDFSCLYPAQMSTTPFVYIRCPGTSNTNIETRSMSGSQTASDSVNLTNHSYILGRAKVNTYDCEFTASTGREFFLDLKQKQLNSLELRLTDAKNRPLGRTGTHAGNQTAAGTGTSQSTLGNLDFTAVLRIDIIMKKQMHYLESKRTEPRVPPRFSGILQKQDGGRDNFGLSPGYQ